MQFATKYTLSLCSSCKAFLGGYLGWILCSNGFLLCNIYKGPTALLQGEMNIRAQPVSSAHLSAQQAPCESTVMVQPLSI